MFEALATARGALEEMAQSFDAARVSGDEAVALLEDLGAIRRLTDGLFAKAARRVSETQVHARAGERSAATMCSRIAGIDVGEARRAIETAEKLDTFAATDAAVRAGQLSARQAQMITDAAAVNPAAESMLIAAAERGLTPLRDACIAARAAVEDDATRRIRQHSIRSFWMRTADDGMVEGHFRVAPEIGGRIKAVVEAETQRRFRRRRSRERYEAPERIAADVLRDLVLGSGATDNGRGSKTTVHIVIDHAALVRGDAVGEERCEIPGVGPVSVSWVRELLGDAFLTAVIKRGRDITTVAHLGRHIPAELRTALIASGRECDIEGCHERGYLELDHAEVDHARGGPTAWWNLGWKCSFHHRLKSMGWILGPPDPVTGKRALSPPQAEARAA